MSVFSPLAPVSDALATALRVASLTAIAPGGVWDALPAQNTSYPIVLIEVDDDYQPSLGKRPGGGAGSMSEIRVRVHVFTQDRGMRTAQVVMAKVVELLSAPAALTVSGYTVCSGEPLTVGGSLPLSDEVIAGVPVRELVRDFRLVVEES